MKKINRILKYVIVISLIWRCIYILNMAITSALSFPHGSFDFQWDAAKLLADRINPYYETLFHNTGYDGRYEMFYDKVEANQFPSLLWILFPFTVFKPYTANILWLLLNLLNIGVIFIIVRKLFLKEISFFVWWFILLVTLCSSPLQHLIGGGQHTLFAVSNFLIAVIIMEEYDKKNRGGA